VIPQVQQGSRLNADQLLNYYIKTSDGTAIPLSTVAKITTHTVPESLNHFQQLNAATIIGVNTLFISQGDALKYLQDLAARTLPQGYSIDYAGQSRQLRTEGGKFLGVFLLSAILIGLVLAAQFESFRDPFVIMTGSAPLAVSGALLFTFLGFTSLNIYSQIGLITLVGLVAKNGILIVEFANHLQERGLDKARAVIEAAGTRLRPILMTTAATVFGHLPLIFARGPGAGARNSIGITLVTGMIIGTAFTLFLVPAIYTLVAKSRVKVAEEEGEAPAEWVAEPAGAPAN
jgi:multidrug efflux pump